jgi:phenylalanyl-tRNA synthetase alpha subunit
VLKEKKKELQQQKLQFIKKQREILDNLLQIAKKENLPKEERENLLKRIQTISQQLKETINEYQKSLQSSEATSQTLSSLSSSQPISKYLITLPLFQGMIYY